MTFFRRFGDSAAFAEASAEPIRPKMAEASAEASVSVVHYATVMARAFPRIEMTLQPRVASVTVLPTHYYEINLFFSADTVSVIFYNLSNFFVKLIFCNLTDFLQQFANNNISTHSAEK